MIDRLHTQITNMTVKSEEAASNFALLQDKMVQQKAVMEAHFLDEVEERNLVIAELQKFVQQNGYTVKQQTVDARNVVKQKDQEILSLK